MPAPFFVVGSVNLTTVICLFVGTVVCVGMWFVSCVCVDAAC